MLGSFQGRLACTHFSPAPAATPLLSCYSPPAGPLSDSLLPPAEPKSQQKSSPAKTGSASAVAAASLLPLPLPRSNSLLLPPAELPKHCKVVAGKDWQGRLLERPSGVDKRPAVDSLVGERAHLRSGRGGGRGEVPLYPRGRGLWGGPLYPPAPCPSLRIPFSPPLKDCSPEGVSNPSHTNSWALDNSSAHCVARPACSMPRRAARLTAQSAGLQ